MDFLKKHYEKVLLAAVLVGLAVAAAFLPFKISSEKEKLQDLTATVTHPKVRELTNLNLTLADNAIKRAGTPVVVDFSPPQRLFAAMPWQKGPDGRLIPLDEMHVGPRAVAATKITPLHTTMTLDSVQTVDSTPRYLIGIIREAAPNARDRSKRQTAAAQGLKNEFFTLRDVQGPPDNPTNLVLELNDGTTAALSKEQAFRRVDGYMADLKYEPEKRTWRDQRVGMSITFNGETYNIVAISENEVVLSAKVNQKKWTVRFNPSATPEPR